MRKLFLLALVLAGGCSLEKAEPNDDGILWTVGGSTLRRLDDGPVRCYIFGLETISCVLVRDFE